MDKTVVITGHSSGIGNAICQKLEEQDFQIIKIKSRLENTDHLKKEIKDILNSYKINILINCAGFGVFRPHEEINEDIIEKKIAVNLTAPILLSKLLLRSIKETQGHIINISSIEATKHSKFSALYTATKSGLRDFSLSLFEEVRKDGVKVTSINPDITNTNFFNELNFKPTDDPQTYLDPKEIADIVYDIITSNYVVTDITLRPQKFRLDKK